MIINMKRVRYAFVLINIILCTACTADIAESESVQIESSQEELASVAEAIEGITENGSTTQSEEVIAAETTSNPEESEEKVVEYTDTTHNLISFHDFELKLYSYYITKYIENGNQFSVFIDSDKEGDIYKPRELHITKGVDSANNETQVSDYFAHLGDYTALYHYDNINKGNVREIYKAIYEEYDYYLIKYTQEMYLVKTNLDALEMDIISLTADDYIVTEKRIINIENCGENDESLAVVRERDVVNKTVTFTSDKNKDGEKFKLELYASGEIGTENNVMSVFINDKEVQSINWDYVLLDSYSPEVIDLNVDGYMDFTIVYGEGTQNKEYYFYVWNPQTSHFENATPQGLLSSSYEVNEGYIKNWGGDIDGYVIEILKWEGNTLVLTDESYAKPDIE